MVPGFDLNRFAVIADIHGNADALRAVLARIDRLGIASIFNLGDFFSGPLAAGETAEILADRPMASLRGNHDRYLITQDRSEMGPSDAVAHDALSAADMDWLRSLPETLQISDIHACHGTPRKDDQYWLEEVTPQGRVQPRALDAIAQEASGVQASLLLCAHTHLPRRVTLPGGEVIVNPGSVGCPAYDDDAPLPHVVESGTPTASFAVIERSGAGWDSTHHQVPYDTRRMADLARANARPSWARAIETGWLTRNAP